MHLDQFFLLYLFVKFFIFIGCLLRVMDLNLQFCYVILLEWIIYRLCYYDS